MRDVGLLAGSGVEESVLVGCPSIGASNGSRGSLTFAMVEDLARKFKEDQTLMVFHSDRDYINAMEKAYRNLPDLSYKGMDRYTGFDYIIFPALAKEPGKVIVVKGTMVDAVRDAYQGNRTLLIDGMEARPSEQNGPNLLPPAKEKTVGKQVSKDPVEEV